MTHVLNRVFRIAAFAALVLSPLRAAPQARSQSPAKLQPIRLHPANPHYFLFRGTAVALITSGEHYGAVLYPDFDYHRYLETLAADGLNYTRLFAGSYVEVPAKSFGILHNDLAPEPGRFLAPWARSDSPGYSGGGNKFDLSRWNPEFFERFRNFLSEASKRGIIVEITLFSSHYGEAQWQLSPFNSANNINDTSQIDWKKLNTLENGDILAFQESFARKIIREANSFDNVIFEIQNEPWSDRPVVSSVINPYLRPPARDVFPNSVDLPDPLSLAWEARVAGWITSEESALPNRHLIAQNYSNFGAPVRALLPQANIINFHYAYPQAVQLNYGLDKAISYDETGFLGQEDAAYRRQAWNFMLSGGSVFGALDYSFTVGHEDGSWSERNGPGGGSPAFRHQLHILSDFLRSFPLTSLRPDMRTVQYAEGVTAHALSTSGHQYAIYLDGDGPAELTLDLPAGDYSCEWLNPSTGSVVQLENFRHKGGQKRLTSPAFQNGIALRLKRAETPARNSHAPLSPPRSGN
ncbi:MAG TPA: hypothetical protein VJN93_16890 [Candidatus Acidoferrum sp.]|nr:hypothetical protein [Candidatus Acidoferrum sp.]